MDENIVNVKKKKNANTVLIFSIYILWIFDKLKNFKILIYSIQNKILNL